MIPKELESFKQIKHFHFKKRHFIYFLYNKAKLRYIGKTTTHPLKRVAGHSKKEFTDLYYIRLKNELECARLEKELIAKYKPFYNSGGDYYKSKPDFNPNIIRTKEEEAELKASRDEYLAALEKDHHE